tara:strand:+ start:110 stop:346 length:237 start_codon:yes stop_codon:yes gene_type:complete
MDTSGSIGAVVLVVEGDTFIARLDTASRVIGYICKSTRAGSADACFDLNSYTAITLEETGAQKHGDQPKYRAKRKKAA